MGEKRDNLGVALVAMRELYNGWENGGAYDRDVKIVIAIAQAEALAVIARELQAANRKQDHQNDIRTVQTDRVIYCLQAIADQRDERHQVGGNGRCPISLLIPRQ